MEHTLQTYLQNPETFHTLVQAAVAGDSAVLPQVRALLDAVPEWSEELGDLLQQTENSLLDMSVGKNLFQREAVKRDLDEHARRLTEEPSYVEELLIKQIRLDLLRRRRILKGKRACCHACRLFWRPIRMLVGNFAIHSSREEGCERC